jgi:hypothetical protein
MLTVIDARQGRACHFQLESNGMNELTVEEIGLVDGAGLAAAVAEGAGAGAFVGGFAGGLAGGAVGALVGGVVAGALYYW